MFIKFVDFKLNFDVIFVKFNYSINKSLCKRKLKEDFQKKNSKTDLPKPKSL